jgi:hypothetical protein
VTYAMFYAGTQVGWGLTYDFMEKVCQTVDTVLASSGAGWALIQQPLGDGIQEQRFFVGPAVQMCFLVER